MTQLMYIVVFLAFGSNLLRGMESKNSVIKTGACVEVYAIVSKSDENASNSQVNFFMPCPESLINSKPLIIPASIGDIRTVACKGGLAAIGSVNYHVSARGNLHLIDTTGSQKSMLLLKQGKENVSIDNVTFTDLAFVDQKTNASEVELLLANSKGTKRVEPYVLNQSEISEEFSPDVFEIDTGGLTLNGFEIEHLMTKKVRDKVYLMTVLQADKRRYISMSNIFIKPKLNMLGATLGYVCASKHVPIPGDIGQESGAGNPLVLQWISANKLWIKNAKNVSQGVLNFKKWQFIPDADQFKLYKPLAEYKQSRVIGINGFNNKITLRLALDSKVEKNKCIELFDHDTQKSSYIEFPIDQLDSIPKNTQQFAVCRNNICIITLKGVFKAKISDSLFTFKPFEKEIKKIMKVAVVGSSDTSKGQEYCLIEYADNAGVSHVMTYQPTMAQIRLNSADSDKQQDSAIRQEYEARGKKINELANKIEQKNKDIEAVKQNAQSLQQQLEQSQAYNVELTAANKELAKQEQESKKQCEELETEIKNTSEKLREPVGLLSVEKQTLKTKNEYSEKLKKSIENYDKRCNEGASVQDLYIDENKSLKQQRDEASSTADTKVDQNIHERKNLFFSKSWWNVLSNGVFGIFGFGAAATLFYVKPDETLSVFDKITSFVNNIFTGWRARSS